MTIQQTIDMARFGELRQLTTLKDESIISFINLGILELYKRFTLQYEEVLIELGVPTDATDEYTMLSNTVYQLPDSCMYILEAYEENETKIPINDEDSLYTINTFSWNKIQVPTPTLGAKISIIYVKSPAILTVADIDSTLQLPPQLTEALLHYIGYRGHGSIDASVEAENNTHYQRFERSCARAKSDGLLTVDDIKTTARLASSGLV